MNLFYCNNCYTCFIQYKLCSYEQSIWTIEFFLNVFTELAEFSDKNICYYSKRAWTCHPATSCVRDQDATTVPARYMLETGSLNWLQFMVQWFTSFPEFAEFSEFLFHLGKTPLCQWVISAVRTIIEIFWESLSTSTCTFNW